MKKLDTVLGILLAVLFVFSCSRNDEAPLINDDEIAMQEEEDKIFEGDALLTSQEDVDDFAGEQYTEITGYLCLGARCGERLEDKSGTLTTIGKSAVISDISELSSLQTIIKGIIVYETGLKNLNGLQNVEGTMELLNLEFNASLEEINALSNISELTQALVISENQSLQNLGGLEGVTAIGELLEIFFNISLTNIEGLGNLTTVSSILIDDNSSLTSLAGLEKITALQHLEIRDNSPLSSLEGLNNLTTLSEELTIFQNKFLTDFCALNPLFTNDGYSADEQDYEVEDNGYNPSLQELKDGNCKL